MKLKYILLILLAVTITGAFIYFKIRKSTDFEPLIKMKLASMVSKASDGLYKLDIGHIEIDVPAGSVLAENITLSPDSVRMKELEQQGLLGNTVYSISLARLNLGGLHPADLLGSKSISLSQLVLDSPDVKIVYKKRNVIKADSGNLYERIASKGESYSIGNLLLKNIRLTVINEGKAGQISSFKNLSASFTDIKIDSGTVKDSTRFLFAKDAVIFLKEYSAVSAKNKYNFTIDSVALRPQTGSMNVFDIKLKPVGTREEFSAKLKSMDDEYDITIKHASAKNINWFALLSEDGLFADEMQLEGGYINVYDDRRLPAAASKEGNYPHQMLMKVKFPIFTGKMVIKDMKIVYEEFNPKASATGKVEFYDVNGTIDNVTNMPEHIAVNKLLKIKASAKLMNAGQMDAGFIFYLDKVSTGDFTTDLVLTEMDGKKMNVTTEALGLIKINDLDIGRLEAHLQGNNTQAAGRIKFAYKNLSVDILKADDEGNMKKRGLLSFIAKNFLLKKSSPAKEGDAVKEYAVSFSRDKQKSFFNLNWKTILEGIKKAVRGK